MNLLGAALVVGQFLATLDPKDVVAFDEYLKGVDAVMAARAAGPESLSGRSPGIVSNQTGKELTRALVHDWTGVAFVPKGTRAKAVTLLEDFSRHSAVYPEVLEGRTEKRQANQVIGFHRLRKKKILEVNMEARYQLDVLPAPEGRYASRSKTLEIIEVDEPGTKREHRFPAGQDHGFLWRLQTYWILEETKDGLWMEVRSISLTRDVPMGLGWAVKPLVKELPREALEALLANTKKAILAAN